MTGFNKSHCVAAQGKSSKGCMCLMLDGRFILSVNPVILIFFFVSDGGMLRSVEGDWDQTTRLPGLQTAVPILK